MTEALTKFTTAGHLNKLEQGRFSGEINLTDRLGSLPKLTIEVLAHGIALTQHQITPEGREGVQSFSFALAGFPDVALPCALRARIVETDTLLACDIVLSSLEDVWRNMMPFQVSIEDIRHNILVLRVAGTITGIPRFELFDWGEPIASSVSDAEIFARGGENQIILLPKTLLDGREHRLTIVHEGSGLPIRSRPILFRFEAQLDKESSISDVAARLDRIERDLRMRFAEAFNAVAEPLYRHIDTITQNQRSNFEREIAAIRQLLGLQAPPEATPLPQEVTLHFGDAVTGYGIHEVQTLGSGKDCRYVAPISGFLMPGVAPASKAVIHVQGLRRRFPEVLNGASLIVNGRPVNAKIYLNPKSGSWNISGSLSSRDLRQDKNLIELRLPNGIPEGEEHSPTADMPVAILYVSIKTLDQTTQPALDDPQALSDA